MQADLREAKGMRGQDRAGERRKVHAALRHEEYASLPYAEQLARKQKTADALLGPFVRPEKILGMDDPLHYRNRAHAVFGRDGSGRVVSGEYREGTHRILEVKDSPIEDELCHRILRTIRKLVISFRVRIYDEDLRTGLFRHAVVRRSFSGGGIMVILVTAESEFPSVKNFVGALRKAHPEITTVVQNINPKKTNLILGEKERVLYGPGYITDSLCGCTFRISASSFFQVNPVQTEVLYKKAMEMAALTGSETVIDAYCGTGTIGIIAAKTAPGELRKGRMLGIEQNAAAVADAKRNARANGMEHLSFISADATEHMERMAQNKETADVIFMDPPRAGSTERFIKAAAALGPSRIVYISCNPETLARDLAFFSKAGYRAVKAQPVDMFPFTGWFEVAALLERSKR